MAAAAAPAGTAPRPRPDPPSPQVLRCAAGWPVLEELYLAANDIAILER